VNDVAFHPLNSMSLLVSAGRDCTIRLFDLRKMKAGVPVGSSGAPLTNSGAKRQSTVVVEVITIFF
jgi:hypothetical protein